MKHLSAALFFLLLLLCSSALAIEVEPAAPVLLSDDISITDYGFASSDSEGSVTEYGYVLEPEEARQANAEKPLYYITFENSGSSTVPLGLYIRGGSDYTSYWSKRIAVPPHSSYTFYGQGHKKAEKYAGSWSVSANGKTAARFALYAN